VDGFKRPILPLNLINPFDNFGFKWYGLVDSGADSCLFNKGICDVTKHNLKADGVKSVISTGISGKDIPTWQHTFVIQLLHPKTNISIWESPQSLINCVDHNEIPLLLGVTDFLKYFNITLDYSKEETILTW